MPQSRDNITWANTLCIKIVQKNGKMHFKVDFKSVAWGHHVYKSFWTPVMDQELAHAHDMCNEAKEHDVNTIRVYLVNKQLEDKKTWDTCRWNSHTC